MPNTEEIAADQAALDAATLKVQADQADVETGDAEVPPVEPSDDAKEQAEVDAAAETQHDVENDDNGVVEFWVAKQAFPTSFAFVASDKVRYVFTARGPSTTVPATIADEAKYAAAYNGIVLVNEDPERESE